MSWTGVIVFWGVSVVFFLVLSLGAAAIPPRNETARVARYVAHKCDWGALATLSSHEPVRGLPFANVFSVSDGPRGQSGGVLYFYLTTMEISVQDLQVNANTSLTMSLAQTPYCRQEHYDPQSPLCAHVIMSGSIQEVRTPEPPLCPTYMIHACIYDQCFTTRWPPPSRTKRRLHCSAATRRWRPGRTTTIGFLPNSTLQIFGCSITLGESKQSPRRNITKPSLSLIFPEGRDVLDLMPTCLFFLRYLLCINLILKGRSGLI